MKKGEKRLPEILFLEALFILHFGAPTLKLNGRSYSAWPKIVPDCVESVIKIGIFFRIFCSKWGSNM